MALGGGGGEGVVWGGMSYSAPPRIEFLAINDAYPHQKNYGRLASFTFSPNTPFTLHNRCTERYSEDLFSAYAIRYGLCNVKARICVRCIICKWKTGIHKNPNRVFYNVILRISVACTYSRVRQNQGLSQHEAGRREGGVEEITWHTTLIRARAKLK